VSISDEQLRALRDISPEARVLTEGNASYVFLPKLPVLVAEQHHRLDALLCPSQHGGYATRLFLEEPLAKANNWTVHSILGRAWHTFSWDGVPANQPLLQILLAHLAVLR
jgi:hypothetical protein